MNFINDFLTFSFAIFGYGAPSISKPDPPTFDSSPNAVTKAATTVDGVHTPGRLDEMPPESGAYTVGVHEDVGSRRTMEDAYDFVIDYAGIQGQGFFAIFDGHSGKHAAEWCGENFHEYLLKELARDTERPIQDVIVDAFVAVDTQLTAMSKTSTTSSGCTAVTAFLRLEDDSGKQPFLTTDLQSLLSATGGPAGRRKQFTRPQWLRDIFSPGRGAQKKVTNPSPALRAPPDVRRVLYTANVGDARVILARAGRAVRLSYDHRGNDPAEASRVRDAGGLVLHNRINGVLAVTRGLGDPGDGAKLYVINQPYTTKRTLSDKDDWLIMASDGLWDTTDDQAAVNLIMDCASAQRAAEILVHRAVEKLTRDSVTVLVVKFSSSITESGQATGRRPHQRQCPRSKSR